MSNIFSSVVSFLKGVPADVEHWFVKEGPAIQTGLSELNGAASIAAGVAAATGETAAVTAIGKVQAGISTASGIINAETTATTLQEQVSAFTAAANELGAVGVNDIGTKAAVAAVTAKINGVASVLSNAAASVPTTQPTS